MKAATSFFDDIQPEFPFQSTPPVKAATVAFSPAVNYRNKFQSTPPVKAATNKDNSVDKIRCISIHAAREGGDYDDWVGSNRVEISIHAAREGGDTFSFLHA